MKVRATKRGYFDHSTREPGVEFSIPDEPRGKSGKPAAFSARWMKPVEAEAPAKKQNGKKGE